MLYHPQQETPSRCSQAVLAQRAAGKEGHVFRKLDTRAWFYQGRGFIKYAPL